MRPLTGEGSLRCCIGTHSPTHGRLYEFPPCPTVRQDSFACALSQDLNPNLEIPHHAPKCRAAVMPRGHPSAPGPHPIPSEGDLSNIVLALQGESPTDRKQPSMVSRCRRASSALELSGGSGLSAGRVLALPATCKTGRKADSSPPAAARMRTQPPQRDDRNRERDAWQAVLSIPARA